MTTVDKINVESNSDGKNSTKSSVEEAEEEIDQVLKEYTMMTKQRSELKESLDSLKQ